MKHCVFRTYRDGAGDPHILYPDPETTLLSDAFAGTAAMKGCLYPFKLASHNGDFGSDTFRGCFTNATTPALDQMSRLSTYHEQRCRVSALVNIAPPVPNPRDLYKIKHQGSWASVSSKSSSGSTNFDRDSDRLGGNQNEGFFKRKARSISRGLHKGRADGSEDTLKTDTDSGMNSRNGRATSLDARSDSKKGGRPWNWREFPVIKRQFRVQKYEEVQRTLQDDRNDHVEETRKRLGQMNPEALYIPLAPRTAPEKTALNDTSALDEAQSSIDQYLKTPDVKEKLGKAAVRILKPDGANEPYIVRSM